MLLSAREVSRTYGGRRALARTDFDLHSGEVVALVGPNGAGKSTLLAVLAGALRPSSGELSRSEPPPRTGWVPQRPAQYGHLSARENLVLFARLARLDDATAAVDALLVRFGLPSGGQPASQLSVGNQQRLNLALGLLGEPEVLLLDEPAASLDPRHRRLLWETVESVRRGGGAVAFATHVMEEADRHATRVVALLDGEVVFTGRPGDLAGAVPELVSP